MIDYKLIEQRLEDALSKETKESLLEWLKNHEAQNQEDQRSVNVDQRVSLKLAEVKRKFNNIPTYKILYDNDEGITFDANLIKMDKAVLWSWIEKNIISKISA